MVLGMPTKSKRRKALATLPTTPYDSFRGIITRIRESNAFQAELGMQVLTWLHFAYRPLRLEELQHALAVEKTHTEFDADNTPPRKALLDSCLGLVVIDDETSTIRFMHFTLEEYFRENAGAEFPNGCAFIAETCLTYLNMGELKQPCTDLDHLQRRKEKYAFLSYAALYWGTYVKQQSSDSLIELARPIVEHDSGYPPCSVQALYFEINRSVETIATKFSGIHVIAYFGLSEIVAKFKFSNVEVKDDLNRTPLSWAAGKGHEDVVRLLLGRDGVDINSRDDRGMTPLSWAAQTGHEAVVSLLIERDIIDINTKDIGGNTPLMFAAKRRHKAVLQLLVEKDGIDLNARGRRGMTTLMWVAVFGYEDVVRLLIERDGTDINAKTKEGMTALMCAAMNGQEAVLRLLLERDDIDINTMSNARWTALTWAADKGHEAAVRLLIERDGIDINTKDLNEMTPRSVAANRGYGAIARLLDAWHAGSLAGGAP